MSVTLINPFEVPKGKETEALQYWEQCAEVLRTAPGFISTRLHRSVGPNAHFMYVNVAEWNSALDFQNAVASEEFKRVAMPDIDKFPHFPGLYEVIRN